MMSFYYFFEKSLKNFSFVNEEVYFILTKHFFNQH